MFILGMKIRYTHHQTPSKHYTNAHISDKEIRIPIHGFCFVIRSDTKRCVRLLGFNCCKELHIHNHTYVYCANEQFTDDVKMPMGNETKIVWPHGDYEWELEEGLIYLKIFKRI